MTENEISQAIRNTILPIHREYGPGLFESVYQKVLAVRLRAQGLKVCEEVPIYLPEPELKNTLAFRIDLLVEDKVIIELKSVETLKRLHFMQLATYVKLTGVKLGLLLNFNSERILFAPGFNRIVNGL